MTFLRFTKEKREKILLSELQFRHITAYAMSHAEEQQAKNAFFHNHVF